MKTFLDSFFRSGRHALATAINTAADFCLSFGTSTNISVQGEAEWQPLAEYGETPYWTQEKGQWKRYRQIVCRANADKMVAAFNSAKAKQGAAFRGLPIYRGHPDADPKQWPDDRRYGGIQDLQAREDGLYAKINWNSAGQENCREGFYIYPSPAWYHNDAEAQATGIISPAELRSVGLTNSPRIPTSKPWTNTDPVGSQFAANNPISPAGEAQNKTNQERVADPKMKKLLLQLLGLPDDATDEQITTKHATVCKSMAANASPLEVSIGDKKLTVTIGGDSRSEFLSEIAALATNATTTASKLTNAQAESVKFRVLAVNAILDRAVDTGRITAAERGGFATKFETDFDGTAAELAGKKIALNKDGLNMQRPGAGKDLSTPHGRTIAFNARIDELTRPTAQGGKGLSLDMAINTMRTNDEDAALLAAMETKAS